MRVTGRDRAVGRLSTLVAIAVLTSCGSANDRHGTAKPDGGVAAFRPLAIGDRVPVYVTRTLAGDTVRLGGPNAVTVLNVWATWCSSCREEMADLQAIHREFAPRGVRVVGVSVDGGDPTRVQRYVAREKLGFTIAHDPAQEVQQRYQVVGVPETFVLGRDGTLLWRHVGNIHPEIDSLRAMVRQAVP